ncbi:MAG: type II secretion system ATPase GspE [Pseudomonadota bacterium]
MLEAFLTCLAQVRVPVPEEIQKIKELFDKNRPGFVEALVDSKLIPEKHVLEALSNLYGFPVAQHISTAGTDADFTSKIPIQFLKRYGILPLIKETGQSSIAIHNPAGLAGIDDISSLLNISDFLVVLATRSDILSGINAIYNRSTDRAQQLVDDMEGNGTTIIQEIEQTADLLDDTSDAPVIRLVNHMISQSVKANASDIHIEPFQDCLNVRYRIDGILYDMLSPPKWIQSALISRIKVMAKMNIAEKRVPQDGRLEVRLGEQEIDIRVSTVPTAFGERLVMRLLNKSGNLLELSEFGISRDNLALFNRLIRLNNGIVLVTGPTGSGKTTTLYAALSVINSSDKNIITIEDPVEYNLKGIGQIQVNRKTGVTFAQGLRSIVRQDPDVILIGEIRDFETAEIAIQSALTGHLVFSTLHTNDSPGAITRLHDLGVEPYLITSSVKAVIAQRLVRILCDGCKEPYTLGDAEAATLAFNSADLAGKKVFKAKGCSRCFNTGYAGRQAIFEIMEMNDPLKALILTTSDANSIKELAIRKAGMVTLRKDGIQKVLCGLTTVEEVLRVTQD